MRTIKILWNMLQTALLVLLSAVLLCNLYVIGARALLHEDHPAVFGWSWAVVLSGSMEPAISLDDLIVIRTQSSYAVGDIITYRSGRSLVTHRIVGTAEEGFLTRGDANNTPDMAPVPQQAIVGRVLFAIPAVGLVLSYLRTPLGLTILVFLGFVLLQLPNHLNKEER